MSVKLISLIGGIIHFLGYLFNWSRAMAIGYLFISMTAAALFSIALAKISDGYAKNKIGNLSVFWFWLSIADLTIYISVELILNEWIAYISFFVFLVLSLVAGITSNKND